MKCNVCGSELEPGAVVCRYCGNRVSNPEDDYIKSHESNMDPNIVYCMKCGRVLDPFTHKCSVCDDSFNEKKYCNKCGRALDPVTHSCPVCDSKEDKRKYCTKCGSVLDPETHLCPNCDGAGNGQKYCIKCGRPLDPVTNRCTVCDANDNEEYSSNQRGMNDEYDGDYDGDYDDEYDYDDGYDDTKYRKPRSVKMPSMGKGVNIRMAKKGNGSKGKKKKKKNTALVITLSVAGMMALFALTFLIFFHLLGGSFSSEEEVTESPSPTATATEYVATPSPTVSPTSPPKKTAAPSPTKAPTPTAKPTSKPAPKPESTHSAPVTNGDYAYPSDSRIITRSELEGMTRQEIKIVLNEIYARHGYTFNDDDLIEYFESKTWYVPTESDFDKVNRMLNDFEAENRDIIVEYQTEQGWR